MKILEAIRETFRAKAPFPVKRKAVEFRNALPSGYGSMAKISFGGSTVNLTWGYPSWSTEMVHVVISKWYIHFWISQGDRSTGLKEFKCDTKRAAEYMAGVLKRCEL